MSDIFQIAGIGLLEGKQRLEAISLNAASASLPGYRRHVVTGRAFDAAFLAAAATNPVAPGEAALALSRHVDLKPGAMITTGRALDVAVEAEDLFFALTDGSQFWLTRAGSFRVNDAGWLVGEHGLRVVGTQGDVRLPGSAVAVTAEGRILHEGRVVGSLQLFRPNDRTSLQAAQGALLITPAGVAPAEPGTGRIRSGVLEASNTDATREMLTLVALSRQFEALSQVMRGYDELLGRAIEKLGGA